MLLWVAIAWSLFQLWYASPLPFIVNLLVLNDTEARAIHLAFALFLAFTAYPALKHSPRDRVPLQDWVLAGLAAFTAAYLYLFYDQLSSRPGRPTTFDLVVAVAGMILLLEATRRALGPPLMVVALVFLAYVFLGPYAPDVLAYQGASLSKAMSHLWLTTEGVFGIALGVSTSFVFMFVLFGSLSDKAGAGNYFIKVAFSLLGHMRGGPAKAAVLSSGLTGLISGSSIANVVTTGTFTIPLMKRVGFTSEKAGAVEVAASVNGQIMPPVMGAAAFLMVEYVGIPYIEVIKHAFLPAVISYIALLYIVHLEALQERHAGLPKRHVASWQQSLLDVRHRRSEPDHRRGRGLLRHRLAQDRVRRRVLVDHRGADRPRLRRPLLVRRALSRARGRRPERAGARAARGRARRSRSACTSCCRSWCWSGA